MIFRNSSKYQKNNNNKIWIPQKQINEQHLA